MSMAKNRRIKERRKTRKFQAKVLAKRTDDGMKHSMINYALAPENKPKKKKKSMQNLVRKFKDLLKFN